MSICIIGLYWRDSAKVLRHATLFPSFKDVWVSSVAIRFSISLQNVWWIFGTYFMSKASSGQSYLRSVKNGIRTVQLVVVPYVSLDGRGEHDYTMLCLFHDGFFIDLLRILLFNHRDQMSGRVQEISLTGQPTIETMPAGKPSVRSEIWVNVSFVLTWHYHNEWRTVLVSSFIFEYCTCCKTFDGLWCWSVVSWCHLCGSHCSSSSSSTIAADGADYSPCQGTADGQGRFASSDCEAMWGILWTSSTNLLQTLGKR